ncbi:MAG: hypothetical protein ACRYFS_06275 [Janthinobacterium lividum]
MESFTRIHWSEQDGCYLAEVPDLPGCIADGAMEAEAHLHAQESAARWIKMAEYMGFEFPVPPQGTDTPEAFIETRVLSNRDRDAFLALLDANPEPTEAAKKAAAQYNKGYYVDGVYHFQLPASGTEADDAPF